MPNDNAGAEGGRDTPQGHDQGLAGNEAAAAPDMNRDPLAGALDQQSQTDTIEHVETADTGVPARDDATYPGGPGSKNTSAPAGAEIGGATPPMGAVAASDDVTCPPDHPVKGDQESMRFHVPGSRGYDDVTPGWCFENEAAALNAGYGTADDT